MTDLSNKMLAIAREDFQHAWDNYSSQPSDFHAAWGFLVHHPAFRRALTIGDHVHLDSVFHEALYIEVVKVEPTSRMIQDDATLNTQTEVWLECGPWWSQSEIEAFTRHHTAFSEGQCTHDHDLDCGGDTFELAIIKLAGKVLQLYGTCRQPPW